jgi:hypothetical protein
MYKYNWSQVALAININIKTRYKIIKVFYSPTDAQVNCLRNNFKIYTKIDIKTLIWWCGCSHTAELNTPMYFN